MKVTSHLHIGKGGNEIEVNWQTGNGTLFEALNSFSWKNTVKWHFFVIPICHYKNYRIFHNLQVYTDTFSIHFKNKFIK